MGSINNKLLFFLGITITLLSFNHQNIVAHPQNLDFINQLFTSPISFVNFLPTTPRSTSPNVFTPLITLGTTTTALPLQILECIQSCPVTSQYNPVCGSNRQTYNNNSALRCAQRCGLSVTQVRAGVCSPRGK